MDTNKIKILIAEDDKLIQNALQDGLTRAGFSAFTAHDGKEALEIAEKIHPCVILLDLAMPVKDGFAVLKELRANEKTKNTHVLVFSNLEDDKSIQRAREMGIDEYLLKADFTIKELIHKIKGHCQQFKKINLYYNV